MNVVEPKHSLEKTRPKWLKFDGEESRECASSQMSPETRAETRSSRGIEGQGRERMEQTKGTKRKMVDVELYTIIAT
jgi:hypothetical protein